MDDVCLGESRIDSDSDSERVRIGGREREG